MLGKEKCIRPHSEQGGRFGLCAEKRRIMVELSIEDYIRRELLSEEQEVAII